MSSYTTTEELLASELFFRAYLSAVEETPDDISRLLTEFKELKVYSENVLRAIDVAIGFGSGKLSAETLRLVGNLLQKHAVLQEEMQICAEKLKVLIGGVTTKLDELAAVSNPKPAVEEPEEIVKVELEVQNVVVKKRRGRKPKKLVVESVEVDGLDLLANAAVTRVSPDIKKETPAESKKVPVTKLKKKMRKRSKTTEASQNEEQSDCDSADDSVGKPDEELFCICNRPSFGKMICCDNESCSIEWFHFECLKLKKPPPNKWYCPKCRGRKSNYIKKELEAAVVKYQKYSRQTRNSTYC